MTRVYAWASCPCGWALYFPGAPVGWKPDPADVEERFVDHLSRLPHLAWFG